MAKVFPNEWEEVAKTPSDRFREVEVKEMMERTSSWELDESTYSIIRVFNRDEGKVTEKVFRSHNASKSYEREMFSKGYEVVVLTDMNVVHNVEVGGE